MALDAFDKDFIAKVREQADALADLACVNLVTQYDANILLKCRSEVRAIDARIEARIRRRQKRRPTGDPT